MCALVIYVSTSQEPDVKELQFPCLAQEITNIKTIGKMYIQHKPYSFNSW